MLRFVGRASNSLDPESTLSAPSPLLRGARNGVLRWMLLVGEGQYQDRAVAPAAPAVDTASGAYNFGVLIRQHRLAPSLSQEALGERARLSVATIAALERGRTSNPRPGTVLLLAEALGLSP